MIVAIQVIKNITYRTPANYFILALGVWVFGQFAASAYARALAALSSRYADLFAVGLVVGFVSLLSLFDFYSPKKKKIQQTMVVAWLAVVTYGFSASAPNLVHMLNTWAMQGRAQEKNVRAYLCTGDITHISDKPYLHIPYPDAKTLALILENKTVRSFLPGNIYKPNAKHPVGYDGEPFCSEPVSLNRPFKISTKQLEKRHCDGYIDGMDRRPGASGASLPPSA